MRKRSETEKRGKRPGVPKHDRLENLIFQLGCCTNLANYNNGTITTPKLANQGGMFLHKLPVQTLDIGVYEFEVDGFGYI